MVLRGALQTCTRVVILWIASETRDQSTHSGVSPLRGIMVSLDHITITITTLVSG